MQDLKRQATCTHSYISVRAFLSPLVVSVGTLFFSDPALCQGRLPIPDDTLGTQSSQLINLNNGTVLIEGGISGGENLFHSFTEFSVPTGLGIYFTNPEGTEHIITRVTGNNTSNIFGTLGVNGSANLFLLNPNGIHFRNGAALEVDGSFVATTANAIQFSGQGNFGSSGLSTPSLLTVAPSAFLFSEAMAAPIINNSNFRTGVSDSAGNDLLGLRVLDGKSLLLLGGDISLVREEANNLNLDGGRLNAPSGRIEIAGIAGVGTIGLNINDDELSLAIPDDLPRADVTLEDKARLVVRGTGAGSIAITARNVNVRSSSFIRAGLLRGADQMGVIQPGDIVINATNDINIEGATAAGRSSIQNIFLQSVDEASASEEVGQGGNILINTGSLFVTDGGQLNTSTQGRGNPGQLIINASDAVTFQGFARFRNGDTLVDRPTFVFSRAEENGRPEQGGTILINARELSVRDGALLSVGSNTTGDAGKISIVADIVNLSGLGPNETLPTRIDSTIQGAATGASGSINIETRALVMTDTAAIDTLALGDGNGGNIEIEAQLIELSGRSRIRSVFNGQGIGNGGDITITGDGDIRLRDNSSIRATVNQESGRGGDITITSSSVIAFDDSNIVAFSPDGEGGNITLNTPAFFGEDYLSQETQQPLTREEIDQLDDNGRVDLNASGVVSGIVTVPDVNFIQDQLVDLEGDVVNPDQLINSSCIAREGHVGKVLFRISGSDGLTQGPRDASSSSYSTTEVESLPDSNTLSESTERFEWNPGDPISEPQDMFLLPGGSIALSQSCT